MNVVKGFIVSSIALFAPLTAFAQENTPAPQPGAGGLIGMLPMMILMFAVIYFFMIRPEQKKQKERAELLKNVKKGDKVLTAGGIVGVVGNVKETTVMVRIAENTNVEFTKSAITSVITDEAGKSSDKEGK